MKLLKPLILILLSLGFASLAFAQDDEMMSLINLSSSDELGAYLVDSEGMTLYTFDNDGPRDITCAGDCLTNWPPLIVASAEELSSSVPTGEVGVVELEDGTFHVTFNRQPLYYWANDEAAGDTTGQGLGDVWWVARPQTVAMGGNDDLGLFLVASNGMTVYTFDNDEEGVSNCTEQCLANWPAVTVTTEDELYHGLYAASADDLGLIERADTGELQVTYQGMPLYYWIEDAEIGDATGQGRGDVWWVVKPQLMSIANNEEHGDFLVGPDGMTLYLFTRDEEGVTNCYEGCAIAWPPLYAINESDIVVEEGIGGEITLIEREDGGLQVVYDGIPLYYWFLDGVPGDTTGQNVNDVWFVVQP